MLILLLGTECAILGISIFRLEIYSQGNAWVPCLLFLVHCVFGTFPLGSWLPAGISFQPFPQNYSCSPDLCEFFISAKPATFLSSQNLGCLQPLRELCSLSNECSWTLCDITPIQPITVRGLPAAVSAIQYRLHPYRASPPSSPSPPSCSKPPKPHEKQHQEQQEVMAERRSNRRERGPKSHPLAQAQDKCLLLTHGASWVAALHWNSKFLFRTMYHLQ